MHGYMCVRVCLCVYACMYVYMCICMYVQVCACECFHVHVHAEVKEQPWLSFLGCCPPWVFRKALTSLELTSGLGWVTSGAPLSASPGLELQA